MSRKIAIEHISLNIRPILKGSDVESAKKQAISTWASLFKETLGLSFNPIFFKAFTHRSFQNEYSDFHFSNYERLEFLGDSLLQTWVTTKLVSMFQEDEGKLSVLRSSIVNEKSLSQLALQLKLESLILLGRGEIKSQGHLKTSLLSDVFEALLGAHFQAYNDIEKTFGFLDHIFLQAKNSGMDIFNIHNIESFDEKTKLQNIIMKKFKNPPVYKAQELSSGEFKYEVSLYIENKEVLKTQTNSIKQTQKNLAKQVLETNLIQEILNPL